MQHYHSSCCDKKCPFSDDPSHISRQQKEVSGTFSYPGIFWWCACLTSPVRCGSLGPRRRSRPPLTPLLTAPPLLHVMIFVTWAEVERPKSNLAGGVSLALACLVRLLLLLHSEQH